MLDWGKTRVNANLEGQSNLGTEVVQSGLWRNSLECLALYEDDTGKHTLKLLDVAF